MTAEELQLSHSIELEVHIKGKKTTLLTSVEHVVENTVLLTPIKLNDKVVGFPADCFVNMLYIEGSQVFCWKNIQLKAIRYENKIYHSAVLPEEAELLNRRGAYRVYIGEEMLLTSFSANGPKSTRVLVKDISETGMAFLSSEEFDVGRTVRLNLSLANGKELRLSGQVIRIQEFEERNDMLYGCKFSERNSILTNYLMRIQQDRQRQKLGM